MLPLQRQFDSSQALIDRTSQIIFSYDVALGQFTYLNPAFEMVFRRSRESITHMAALLEMVHPQDLPDLEEKYRQLLEGVRLIDVEFRILLPDGTECWLCLTPFLLEEEDGQKLLTGFANDISAVKEHNSYLKSYSDKKNAVLNIVSHDLAGPLAMIESLSTLLLEDLQQGHTDDMAKLLNLIRKSSRQGTQLIQEFVSQEFLESTRTEVVKHRLDIVNRLKLVIEEYQQSEQTHGKAFRFSASSEAIYMELDDNKFVQCINNLISNAMKFTPDGGSISVRVKEEEGDTVLFSVADTGIGIPATHHAELFDKFTSARRPGIKGEPSVGLGMSIIKTIVEWHQGEIWFESEENKGTTFYIRLPRL